MATNPGDIAFVGYNADGNDDFAIVAIESIDGSGTPVTITFTDNAWDGSSFNATEGTLTWTVSTLIPAGTVITFNNLSATPTASVGSLSVISGTLNLAATNEALFAITGTTASPTAFLAAIANDDFTAAGSTLTGTGLTVGTTANELDDVDADADVAIYTGSRSGDRSTLLAAINTSATDWSTQDGTGDQSTDGTAPDLPFDTTAFTVSGSPTPPPTPTPTPTPPTVGSVLSDRVPVNEANPLEHNAISNETAEDTVTLSNTGSEPLEIRPIIPQFPDRNLPAGMNTEDVFILDPSADTVQPGASITIRVTLRGDLLPGNYSGRLLINTNDPNSPNTIVPVNSIVSLPLARDVAPAQGAQLPDNSPVWTSGDDILIGASLPGNPSQWLNGGPGNDLIFGNRDRDVLTGGPGEDTLLGGRGDDFIRGADGNDVLSGDRGNDTLQGNDGADTFVLVEGFGSDLILDFEDGRDRILLAGPLEFADLTLQDQGNSTQIRTGDELLATLVGVDSSLLTSADFL